MQCHRRYVVAKENVPKLLQTAFTFLEKFFYICWSFLSHNTDKFHFDILHGFSVFRKDSPFTVKKIDFNIIQFLRKIEKNSRTFDNFQLSENSIFLFKIFCFEKLNGFVEVFPGIPEYCFAIWVETPKRQFIHFFPVQRCFVRFFP